MKFEGMPSSLLHAVAEALAVLDVLGEPVGYLDPGTTSDAFYEELADLVEHGSVRAVCLSTSTAAIEEARRIVDIARGVAQGDVLIVAGGPHEDDCELKIAEAMPGVDLSVAGDAEHALKVILASYLAGALSPRRFCSEVLARLNGQPGVGGLEVTSRWWPEPFTRRLEGSAPSSSGTTPRPLTDQRPSFSVFQGQETVPLMISRGCSYGRCTFCAEANTLRSGVTSNDFAWVERVARERPGAVLYFQDSIFPSTDGVRQELLPLLRDLDCEWGCQLFLPMVQPEFVELLAEHGCSYVYTGIENASSRILRAVRKGGLSQELVRERLGWVGQTGMSVGVSVMFGAVALDGTVVETVDSVQETVELCEALADGEVRTAGFYPNVQTVLPGTPLARGLAEAGLQLDFYRMPIAAEFLGLEDGAVGYTCATMPGICDAPSERRRLVTSIVEASTALAALGLNRW